MKRVRSAALVLAFSAMPMMRAGAGEESIHLLEAPGHDLTASRCVICHSLDYIAMNAEVMDRAGWQKTIKKMVERFGAPIADDEAGQILDYLDAHYTAAVR